MENLTPALVSISQARARSIMQVGGGWLLEHMFCAAGLNAGIAHMCVERCAIRITGIMLSDTAGLRYGVSGLCARAPIIVQACDCVLSKVLAKN